MIDAIIPIWKPVSWTSFDVVKKIRSQIKPAKVGHTGTLDPFAEGILVLCTGKSTKLVEEMMDKKKEYEARIKLGQETDTLDPTGNLINTAPVPKLNKVGINAVLKNFVGKIRQVPPMFSALKINGTPLYKLARKGIEVEREPREITIDDIKLLNFTKDELLIHVKCGRGTYIRTLAKDIAQKLGTVGHLLSLKRTRVGDYYQIDCITIEEFPEWKSAIV